ncbi:alkanesulfonate transporter substrate-binding subunit [Clostridium homopropionicum DSM 5847]|uniref:Alkanesulfonate transporter substrate-binding subunit n=1 Tax=Clostridium homopropionicum DSM 5847 TaxID=1121318 RepID=A0A0L6Z7M6_9CLOT|nr:ABC transporter substrate-binding protein [Clostridium homopropionicum]KOA18972.1 alkanesulfonate transporter substrate-binding subunit [Clostridium homopropionicum DSM 5847]SFG43025.1 NitT/TauT family transport system substrate-binding protein [Clostridium homopropionicum]
MTKTFQFKYKALLFIFLCFLNFSFLLMACSNKNEEKVSTKLRIAEQYGLAYAPLQIMKANKILEKNLPGIEISWQQVSNTTAIREAMLSNKIDAGFMAIPPFLIGLDKGMEWKIASGLSYSPTKLITNKNDLKSLEDFTNEDKIALPQPGSVQHILLSMACEKQFGDSHKLDNLILTLSHPDAMNSLLSGNGVSAHFASPPYIGEELKNDKMHIVLDGRDVMEGDFTFIIGVTTKEFYTKNPKLYSGFVKSIDEAIDFINNNTNKAAEILAPSYNLSKEQTYKLLTADGNKYSTKVEGLEKFSQFMLKNEYISKTYTLKEVMWNDNESKK